MLKQQGLSVMINAMAAVALPTPGLMTPP